MTIFDKKKFERDTFRKLRNEISLNQIENVEKNVKIYVDNFVKEYKDLRNLRNKTLSSHLNKTFADVKILKEIIPYIDKIKIKKLWSKKIINMLINYFYEMDILLSKLNTLIRKNGKCVIVVGNSSYGNVAIPTDEILKNLGRKNGFKNNYIIQARKLGTSSQQYKKIDNLNMLRESLVVLSK